VCWAHCFLITQHLQAPRSWLESQPSTPENATRRQHVSYDTQSSPRTPQRNATNNRPALRPAFTNVEQRAGTSERHIENQVRRDRSCGQSSTCAQSPTRSLSPAAEEPERSSSNNPTGPQSSRSHAVERPNATQPPSNYPVEVDIPTDQVAQPATPPSNVQPLLPSPDIPDVADAANSNPGNEPEAEVVVQQAQPQIQSDHPGQLTESSGPPQVLPESIQSSTSPRAEGGMAALHTIQPPDAALEDENPAPSSSTSTPEVEQTLTESGAKSIAHIADQGSNHEGVPGESGG
jgi:hypothetical protein